MERAKLSRAYFLISIEYESIDLEVESAVIGRAANDLACGACGSRGL